MSRYAVELARDLYHVLGDDFDAQADAEGEGLRRLLQETGRRMEMTLTPEFGENYEQPALPPEAVAKLAALRTAADEADAVYHVHAARMREDPTDELRAVTAEKKKLRDDAAQVVARCVGFVNANQVTPYVGEIDASKSLQEIRDEISELRAEAAQVAKTPPSAATVATRARARLALLGELELDRDGTLSFGDNPVPGVERATRIVAMLAPELVGAAIDAAAKRSYPPSGITDADRRIRLRDIDDAILALERSEALLCHRSGEPVRKNCSPLALLGLAMAHD